MSITRCKICDNQYDQDTDVEHKEMCGAENKMRNAKESIKPLLEGTELLLVRAYLEGMKKGMDIAKKIFE